MRAVVLVGGFGTRLRPLTLTTPKPLLPVGQRTILEHVVGHLGRHGISEAILSIGFNPAAFREAFPAGTCAGVALAYAVEPEPLDTAGAIRFAALQHGVRDTFVVVNGDVLTDLDVTALVAFHGENRARGGEATIHLTPVEDPSAFGVVPTDPDGRVQAFIEKPPRDSAPTNLVNAGTYVLEPSVVARIDDGRKVSIERETFPALVDDQALFAMATNEYWLDAGRPDLYLQANLDAIDGVRRDVHEPAVAASARVHPDATVEHAVVGPGVEVGAGAGVRHCVLMAGAVVGPSAQLTRTVVGFGATIGPGGHLTDCVVGHGMSVAPGAGLQSVRIPEPA